MQGGELKEQGAVREIFYRPRHPYTRALLAAVPRLDATLPAIAGRPHDSAALVAVQDLKVHFPVARGIFGRGGQVLHAVDGVDLTLAAGETLGVVGESGSGKSTLARAILQLVAPTAGRIAVLGRDMATRSPVEKRAAKRDLQVIFQDPLAALNPRMTVGEIVREPLWTHRPELSADAVRAAVVEVLRRVGLTGAELNRYPHEFSGGQCQRIGIARALVLQPKIVICDEPLSALDVSIQAQIVELLLELRHALGLALIFIAHDLAVVRRISHRVMVMYLGQVVETAGRDALFAAPRHPYTRALLDAVPLPDPDRERARPRQLLRGDLPSPIDPPPGCRFASRCPKVMDVCRRVTPPLAPLEEDPARRVACHLYAPAGASESTY
jgi:oligopeptide transport system ATP-binding protein